jgi:hypothetical protein
VGEIWDSVGENKSPEAIEFATEVSIPKGTERKGEDVVEDIVTGLLENGVS